MTAHFRQVRPDILPEDTILSAAETIYAAVYLERFQATAYLLWRRIPQANFNRRTLA